MASYLWLLLCIWAVDFLALVSPGPNFLMVTQTAMQRSRRYALAVAIGIACGTAAWGMAVAVGLSALFSLVPWLHIVLRIGGAAYLIYLGIRLWRSSDLPNGQGPVRDLSIAGAYLRGLTTSILNPKSAAYFGSVFSLFFPPGTPGWLQVTAVALISLSSVLWHGSLAVMFSIGRIRSTYRSLMGSINRIAGAILTALGLRLLLTQE